MTYPPQGPYPPQGYPPPGGPPQGFPPPYRHQQPTYQQQTQPYQQQQQLPPPPQFPPSGGIPQQSFPPPGLPPPKPGGTSGGARVLIGVVVAGVIGLIVIAVANWGTSARAAEEGDCIKVISTSDADAGQVECTAPEAIYKVARKLDSAAGRCPEGDYTEWVGGKRTDTVKLCLMLNAKEGDCFKTTTSSGNESDERVACSSADFKVVKVVSGKADKAACASGNLAATYSQPATTLCLSKA
jgi:hypothetical protein